MEAPVNRAAQMLPLLAFIAGAAGATATQRHPEPPFRLKAIGSNVWAAIDNAKAQVSSAANAGFVIGDDGVVVIDTFANIEAAKQLLAEIRKLTNLPIKFVINTHHHSDHVAGNRIFVVDARAVVLAQRNVREWIHTENLRAMTTAAAAANDVITPAQRALVEAFVPPTVVYDQALDLYLGSREIHVRGFPGHTGGDSIIMIPDAKIAFTGDLFWRHNLPNTIDASTKPWIDTLNTLIKNEVGYAFVPGHGDVGNTQDVTVFRDYLATLRKLVADAQAQGKSAGALVDAVIPRLTAQYGQWDYFKYLLRPNILEMDAELRGTKTVPKPRRAY
jgi:cyclase